MRLTVHLIFYAIALLCVLSVWLFSVMYLKEMYKAKQYIQIEAPLLLVKMLKANIYVCIGTTIVIILSLLYELAMD